MQSAVFDRNSLGIRPLSERKHDLDISVVTKPDPNGRFMSDERLKMRRRADNSRKRERRGGLYIVVFHAIVDTAPTTYQTLTAVFQAISDYLKTKQDAGLLEVITFSDYYYALIDEPFCLEEPAMDFNGDCRVDFADFALFAQSWLECNLDPESACWE